MTCHHCKKPYNSRAQRCPHCGKTNPDSGVFQTSTVLIASSETDSVYRSVEDVPAALRSKLIQCTNGANSGTILIADRRGREEIARAMRSLPGPAQRKLLQAVLGSAVQEPGGWRSQVRRAGVAGLLLTAVTVLMWLLFVSR